MAATIADVAALGYDCGIASGSVQAEQDAVAQATADARPDVISAQATPVVLETVQQLDSSALLPDDADARTSLIAEITGAVIDQLNQRASDRIDFHQRALAIAQTMPDTWHVSGYGNTIYVNCKDDGTGWDDNAQEILDALADPGSHDERVWQFDNPDVMAAATVMQAHGYLISRPDLGGDSFTVDGGKPITSVQLAALAETAEPKPSTLDLIGQALTAAPGLDAATKKLIQAALDS